MFKALLLVMTGVFAATEFCIDTVLRGDVSELASRQNASMRERWRSAGSILTDPSRLHPFSLFGTLALLVNYIMWEHLETMMLVRRCSVASLLRILPRRV